MIEIKTVTPEVTLVNHTQDPLFQLWLAFKTCYSSRPPQELVQMRPTDTTMINYVRTRLKTEHTSPLEQVGFTFAISGVSRVFTHQFVRHRVGVSVAQQSGRYTDPIDSGVFEYVEPFSAKGTARFEGSMQFLVNEYYRMVTDAGVPREDARFILPSAQATSMVVTINLAALLHMADIRMCLATQWEFGKVVRLMRKRIMETEPEIGRLLGPKCMEYRRGACDEDIHVYDACALSAVRPHKLRMEQ